MQRFCVFSSIARPALRATTIALVAASLMLTGCANSATHVTSTGAQGVTAQTSVPVDVIDVYAFDSDAADVTLDTGLAQSAVAHLSGTAPSADAARAQQAIATRGALADEIVRELRAKGLNARRADRSPGDALPVGQSALAVTGRIDAMDAGKSRRRMLVGFGAGKSDMRASVDLTYRPASGAAAPLQSFSANADSGAMPGVIGMTGVGALAGHAATSAVTSTGVHGIGEVRHDALSADAKRMADAIAKRVAQMVTQKDAMSGVTHTQPDNVRAD